MTLLMVTPYPPYRDGIGAYAVQEVRRLRAEGVEVEVLSPLPSAAHHHLALGTLRGVLALVKKARHYDATMIQFSPEMFFGSCRGPLERVAVWVGLEALARVTELEIRQHEIEWGPLKRNPAERAAAARALRAAATVSVHTQGEVERLTAALGIEAEHVTVVEHGRHFLQATAESQTDARVELGLHPDRHLFLSIGFLQEHKGFDRAAEAFRAAGLTGQAELHIVGSVRVNHPDLVAHANALHQLARTIPGVEVHQRYVSDEEFDRWILAADTVVLPYREIWSSSVLERAKLLARPIVAADVGGLGDQAPAGTLFFDDAESLAQCLKERAATTTSRLGDGDEGTSDHREEPLAGDLSSGQTGWRIDDDQPDRQAIESQIRDRAIRARRPGSGPGTGPTAVDSVGPLLRLDGLQRPSLSSARPGVGRIKQTLRRLLDWELEPITQQLDRLRTATTEAVLQLDESVDAALAAQPTRAAEETFVDSAVAEAGPEGSVLVIGTNHGGPAARWASASRPVTMADVRWLSATGDLGRLVRPGGYDVVVVDSASLAPLLAVDPELERVAALLATGGRLVLAATVGSDGPAGPAGDGPLSVSPSALVETLARWQVRQARAMETAAGGLWRLGVVDGVDEVASGLIVVVAERS